ncbi:enoyl-ACP reductase FabI [Marinobacterium weihaiense]|uniref:Enoyl-[acyl-carrier-protein] reductase [NADH] n=1 Tax=Marinobacterium weihaiense TaxID=2851016 RepID=A0ABS6MDS5_9GAMM|nr:enoyl-ACP reductase FabI [Marinobacterium weihaiense]MBV0934471.1 enoyl-ACP reductase FabI [Marinobacterium weihaiense]
MLDLTGKKGLVFGVANDNSIAFGCASALREQGAELALTYLNEKARPHVEPLAERLGAALLLPCNVANSGELGQVFEQAGTLWGKLDFVIHSIAWSPLDDLHGALVDSSADGFAQAMDVSCHSFIRMARLARPWMKQGGTLLTMSYQGAERVVEHYNLMGPVKAALECSVRYLAAELGPEQIRVHALSPGPMPTRAASGITDFNQLMAEAERQAPLRHLGTPEDVGHLAAFLISDRARNLTGSLIHVDAGQHVLA